MMKNCDQPRPWLRWRNWKTHFAAVLDITNITNIAPSPPSSLVTNGSHPTMAKSSSQVRGCADS